MGARVLMIQGTGSGVGKSLICAALCRALARRGARVAPFKPQNMSNNAAVTADGGEIGRAQALQALAAGRQPRTDMNPLLLKPESERGAQVIVQGRRAATMSAREYFRARSEFMPAVMESFARLCAENDVVIVEGAGSPAEVNLRDNDLANMGFAELVEAPVVLVGDIHRGGVIAALVGTLEVIGGEDARRVRGLLVNNFHGDPELFREGAEFIERRTGKPLLGIVPHFPKAARLPAEDAATLGDAAGGMGGHDGEGSILVAVPRLSRIANFDDLDPLRAEPSVRLEMIPPGRPLPADAALVIIPGSKASMADMAFMRRQGWDIDIRAHARRGGRVLGICGGYQMLGRVIHDRHGVEGKAGSMEGVGLLEVETHIEPAKTTRRTNAVHAATGEPIEAYEIHMGASGGDDCARPFATVDGRPEGAVSADGRVMGTYLHGAFASDGFRAAFIEMLGGRAAGMNWREQTQRTLDELAEHVERHVDMERLMELAEEPRLAG